MSYVDYESIEIEEIKQTGEAQKLESVVVLGDRVRLGRKVAPTVDETLTEVLDLQLAQGSMPA